MTTTNRYKSLHQLSPQQERVLEHVLAGRTDTDIASKLKLHRVTINRWRNHHPEFVAELNRRRLEAFEALRQEHLTLMKDAFERVRREVTSDSAVGARIAWDMIRDNKGLPVGPLASEEVVRAWARRTKESEFAVLTEYQIPIRPQDISDAEHEITRLLTREATKR